MKTAEQLIKNTEAVSFDSQMRRFTYSESQVKALMIEFTKLHVEAALQEAGKIANQWENSGELQPEILNAYPLENIK